MLIIIQTPTYPNGVLPLTCLLCYNLTSKTLKQGGLIHMATTSTTKMSSKGQVVIPEDIRKQLNLKTGSQFIIMGENDVVILKTIKPPSMAEFDSLIAKARSQGKKAGLKQFDITTAISKGRGRK